MSDIILTADPQFIDLAWHEFQDHVGKAKRRADLADGVILASCRVGWYKLGQRLLQHRPTFMRHVNPVAQAIALDDVESDLDSLKREIRAIVSDELPTSSTFSVQTRMVDNAKRAYRVFDVNRALSDAVTRYTGAQLDVRNPEYVLSVVLGQLEGQSAAFIGLSEAQHNLSNWAGGERRYKRENAQISRAEFKLLEAIEWFNIDLPQNGLALDLGAAPGGWTRVLRQLQPELRVIAVDPGRLHVSLMSDHGVEHHMASADHYLSQIDRRTQFDIIVNDMRLDGFRSADITNAFAQHLAPSGSVVMTVKLPQSHPRRKLDDTLHILGRHYTIGGVRQLFHNRHEVTVHLQKSA